MKRLHKPLIRAGYIVEKIGYEVTHDREGRPDWIMLYEPGPRAWNEFKAFTRRPASPAQLPLPLAAPPPTPESEPSVPAPEPEPSPLVAELVERGVSPGVAAELVRNFPEERIRAQIAALDWHRKHSRKKIAEPGAYLAEAIRKAYAPPAGMVAAAKRAEQQAAEEAKVSATRADRARQQAEQAQVDAYWRGLNAAERAALEAAALEHADDLAREQMAKGRPKFVEARRQSLREDEIRRRLGLSSLDGAA
jgi:hypothetical protein